LANRVVNHALSASLIVDLSIIYGLDTVSRPPRQRTVTLTSGHTHLFSMVTWYCGCRPPSSLSVTAWQKIRDLAARKRMAATLSAWKPWRS
jgi:hypothetical protein